MVSMKHELVSLDEKGKIPPSRSLCSIHPGEELLSYCNDDSEAACPICVKQKHQGHSVSLLSEAMAKVKQDILVQMQSVGFLLSFFFFFFF